MRQLCEGFWNESEKNLVLSTICQPTRTTPEERGAGGAGSTSHEATFLTEFASCLLHHICNNSPWMIVDIGFVFHRCLLLIESLTDKPRPARSRGAQGLQVL